MHMYRVYLSNGFDTVIDWDGRKTIDLSVVFEIAKCWYADLTDVIIIKLERI